jgi:protein gp37
MADVFEDRRDLDAARARLWQVIETTPNLDWLLLTKRPELAPRLAPWGRSWPFNVWLGTTIETQLWAQRRLPHLAAVQARVRFVSCEPLLGPLDLSAWLGNTLDWVIAGGESGAKARKSEPAWFRLLRDQCVQAHVPFHFKQWGNWTPVASTSDRTTTGKPPQRALMRTSKAAAGRELDGRTWNGLPAP